MEKFSSYIQANRLVHFFTFLSVCIMYRHFCHYWFLLGAFAKLRKATISFVISACTSLRPHGTTWLHWMDFL